MVIEKIATEEKLELDQEKLKNEVSATLGQIISNPSFKKPKNSAEYKQLIDAVSFDTANRLFNQQLMDKLVEIGSGNVASETVETPVVVETPVTTEEPEEVSKKSPSKPKKTRAKKEAAQ